MCTLTSWLLAELWPVGNPSGEAKRKGGWEIRVLALRCEVTTSWLFSTGDNGPPGIFTNVRGHVWLSQLGGRDATGTWGVEASDATMHRTAPPQRRT